MAEALEPIAGKAKARLRRRHANPGVAVELEKGEEGYRLASPHRDHEAWEAMICDALGTRSIATAKTFVHSLVQLCSQTFKSSGSKAGEWCPDETELNIVLNIATSIKPRNEIEAALAAQMTAVHMMTMKTAAQALEGWGTDPRAAALSAKLARTFTLLWEALMRHRGRGRTVRQNITVSHEKHIHQHQHVHLEGGGSKNGSQACEPSDSRNGGNNRATPLIEYEGGTALPGRTRRGSLCQCPANKGKSRCRIHGGASGSGAPKGEANGSYKHGAWTVEAVELRRAAARVLRQVKTTV
jgi:hypothetical protein